MKKIYWLFIFFGIFILPAQTQINKYGVPFFRNFDSEVMNATDNNWAAVIDHRGVLYLGNNDVGVVEYDGAQSRTIPLSNQSGVRSLICAEDGTIYVGGEGDFGYLSPDPTGFTRFVSFLPKLDSLAQLVETVYKILEFEDDVYFCTQTTWYAYNVADDVLKTYRLRENGFKNGNRAFLVNGHLYQGEYLAGLIEFSNGAFDLIKGGETFSRKNILSILPYSDSKMLIGTHASGVYLYDQKTGEINRNILSPGVNDFLKTNGLYSSDLLPGKHFAYGTLRGGAILTDSVGEAKEIFNRDMGLMDQQITSIYHNPNQIESGQLWTVMYNGLARVEYFSPFRVIEEKSGIQGTINDITYFNHTIYVATSVGVFYQAVDESGRAHFSKIQGIDFPAWSFLKLTPPGTKKEIFWAGTEGGVYEITGDNKVKSIENRIKNLLPAGRKFNTYTLFTNPENPNRVFIGTSVSIFVIEYHRGEWYLIKDLTDVNDEVRSLSVDASGSLWAASNIRGIVRFDLHDTSRVKVKRFTTEEGLPSLNNNFVYFFGGQLHAATLNGLYTFNETTGIFEKDPLLDVNEENSQNGIFRIVEAHNGDFWLSRYNDKGQFWVEMKKKQKDGTFKTLLTPLKRLPNKSADAIFLPEEGPVWIGISDKLYTFNTQYNKNYAPVFPTLIREVRLGEDSVIFAGAFSEVSDSGRIKVALEQPSNQKPIIKYKYNNLAFNWACPYFEGTGALQYSFRIIGFSESWSKWSARTEFTYTNLPHGDLVFEVKAKNIYGKESTTASFSFTILPPWYQTFWAYFLYVIAAFVLVIIIVKLYTRRLQHEKIRLEGIVVRRTAEVVSQKEELEDSITYASRIQRAILPSERVLNENLSHHFILFKPRDIVSGDFYWMTTKHDKIIVVAADCTGHGVPGAFMSLLGMSFLNEIVNKSDIVKSDKILSLLRKEIMTSLKQTGKEGEAKDGMDIALCIIDKKERKIQFSGAYNPLFMVRPLTKTEKEQIKKGIDLKFPPRSIHNNSHVLLQIAGDKMPIGISAKDLAPFKYNEIDFGKDYSFYIFSDGYVDQFGGPNGKKFMVRAFKKMILELQDQPMSKQGEIFENRFREWKGKLPQVDDILVIGFKTD